MIMKSILVTAGGGDTDEAVFTTALAAARPLGAHLEFFHAIIDPGEALRWHRHAGFATGPALREMMEWLRLQSETRATTARNQFAEFCKCHKILVSEKPRAHRGVSANWREQSGDCERLIYLARHHDLVALGRPTEPNGLPPDLLEMMLIGCGKPLLIASAEPPHALLGTVMVCWKETPEVARAVSAAMPLLFKAERVVLAGVDEGDPSLGDGLAELSRQLAWHGVGATVKPVLPAAGPVVETLMATARSVNADLLVMGGYGHSRTREFIFGGVTQSVLKSADIAVLIMH